ncbi:MAG TPA: 4'-phosphopantetheinyl transferase superfamily protein [Gemmatimonadaceae bacterium]|nr:4'-phosphopantetheinyl transferase superfamily protein [Gemmatimonadaceae bacterium]
MPETACNTPAALEDTIRRLGDACALLQTVYSSAKPFHTTLRLGSDALLAVAHGSPDRAMLLQEDLQRADRFPSAKRRLQFLLGRAAANRAVASLTGSSAESVGRGPQGEPLWPAGLTGSISHSGATAVSIVMRREGWSVGIDIEAIEETKSSELVNYVLDPRERLALANACGSDDRAFFLGFSLKEAVLKSLLPRLRQPAEFKRILLLRVRPAAPVGIDCDWSLDDWSGFAFGIDTGDVSCAVAVAEVTGGSHASSSGTSEVRVTGTTTHRVHHQA